VSPIAGKTASQTELGVVSRWRGAHHLLVRHTLLSALEAVAAPSAPLRPPPRRRNNDVTVRAAQPRAVAAKERLVAGAWNDES